MPRKIVGTLSSFMLASIVLGAAGCSTLTTRLQSLGDRLTASAAATATFGAQGGPMQAPPSNADTTLLNALKRFGLTGGIVCANGGSSATLKLGQNADQLQVAAGTIIAIPGQTHPTISDVQVGDRVIAKTLRSPGQAAGLLLVVPLGYTGSNVLPGFVLSSTSGELAVRAKGSQRQVAADASTVVINSVPDQPVVAPLSSLVRGSPVLIIGAPSGDTFTAQTILIVSTGD